MTDRAHSLQVILKDDYRVDDLEVLMNAIRLMHGVADVIPLIEDNMVIPVAETRAKLVLREKIWEIVK